MQSSAVPAHSATLMTPTAHHLTTVNPASVPVLTSMGVISTHVTKTQSPLASHMSALSTQVPESTHLHPALASQSSEHTAHTHTPAATFAPESTRIPEHFEETLPNDHTISSQFEPEDENDAAAEPEEEDSAADADPEEDESRSAQSYEPEDEDSTAEAEPEDEVSAAEAEPQAQYGGSGQPYEPEDEGTASETDPEDNEGKSAESYDPEDEDSAAEVNPDHRSQSDASEEADAAAAQPDDAREEQISTPLSQVSNSPFTQRLEVADATHPHRYVDAAGSHSQHHKKQQIRYNKRERRSKRRLLLLRNRLRGYGRKGTKKAYKLVYYRKKTNYPIAGLNSTVLGAAGIVPETEVTYKKVKASKKAGAEAFRIGEKLRGLKDKRKRRFRKKIHT
ncbi:hypothetical protein HDU97_009787 [Phlyctochytrium planicorne]|nr:hypothetical protein HDU97_009787 [Phlyctochytrium planicorne]